MEKEEFLKLLPKLIREDDEVKGAILTALSGVVATKEDIAKIIEHSDKRFEVMNKRFEAMDKRFEEATYERKEISKKVSEISVAIGSLGDRSGKILEDTIIEILNDELIKENIPVSKIQKELMVDEEGIVFTKNFSNDIDVLIEDGKTILIEVKYRIDNYEIFSFLKVAELYVHTRKPFDQLLIITLEIKRLHLNYANQQGIKVIAGKVIE
ncbi:unnamed protein product [marine sediment metagenome]|uniref:DUF3782 domain-containing protein n=1 Tax=marine sediment metagenome TaxID=412755 RepID=X0WBS8_9ZZZZ